MSGIEPAEKLIRYNIKARHTYEGKKKLKVLFSLRKHFKQNDRR